ncbi:protein kinase [Stieleria sp. JC731]|uniref:protein kinase domain-containing protein n=1 Tax=Pirellulaceae TaxID=2691357 RepID=UPI001E599C04|nr:FHA domain-containing serine/threonine-protein kinase [Stieleria sp. JC731]MCC9600294.1 protein kinase [Stieleria sp. JC731]
MPEQTIELERLNGKPRHRVRLTVTDGPHRGRTWVFAHPVEIVIGRETPSNLVLNQERAFSREHAKIVVDPPSIEIFDLDSRNGTYVNGIRLAQATLADGDRFGVGETALAVEVIDDAPDDGTLILDAASQPTPLTLPKTEREEPASIAGTFAETRNTGPRQTTPNNTAKENVVVNLAETIDSDAASPSDFDFSEGHGDLTETSLADRFAVGQVIGTYSLDEIIGSGGMASVFRASHRRSGEQFAIKLIRSDLDETDKRMQLFVREATMLTQMRHPRIVEAFELGIHGRSPYLVMEFIENQDLLALIDSQSEKQKRRTAIWVIGRVLEALHYLHSKGVVHRDIKPGNILAYKEAHRLQVKLADFGLAKLFLDSGLSGLTSEKSLRGTLAYMSPEHFHRSVDAGPEEDLFSCGATLFRLLTSSLPNMVFRPDETLEILHESPLPSPLKQLIHRSIHPDKTKRFRSVEEFVKALKSARDPQ